MRTLSFNAQQVLLRYRKQGRWPCKQCYWDKVRARSKLESWQFEREVREPCRWRHKQGLPNRQNLRQGCECRSFKERHQPWLRPKQRVGIHRHKIVRSQVSFGTAALLLQKAVWATATKVHCWGSIERPASLLLEHLRFEVEGEQAEKGHERERFPDDTPCDDVDHWKRIWQDQCKVPRWSDKSRLHWKSYCCVRMCFENSPRA